MRGGLRDEEGRERCGNWKNWFRLVDESPMWQVTFFHETCGHEGLNVTERSLSYFLLEAGSGPVESRVLGRDEVGTFVLGMQPAMECGLAMLIPWRLVQVGSRDVSVTICGHTESSPFHCFLSTHVMPQ